MSHPFHQLSALFPGVSASVKPMVRISFRSHLLGIAFLPLVGVLSFWSKAPDPNEALQNFINLFKSGNAAGLQEIIHPDMLSGKEIRIQDVENFIRRFRHEPLVVQESSIDRKMKSEDDQTERFQATVVFRGPPLTPHYPGPSILTMELLWAMQDGRWWLERPLSIFYSVTSTDAFPTDRQREAAMKFEAACGVLDRLGLKDNPDPALLGKRVPGTATDAYAELEQLHKQERDKRGISPDSRGVDLLLTAAGKEQGGFLQIYHGDFRQGPEDKRKPVPWEVLRDYVTAALLRGKTFEKRMNPAAAQRIYRQVIAIGRQLLDEPGGYSYANWGLTFQEQGAQELTRALSQSSPNDRAKVSAFANLVSRRLDSVQTALGCLDDLADYRALEAAIMASQRVGDTVFRPWAINTLAILSLKGAPATREAMQTAGGLVLVSNRTMQDMAGKRLEELVAHEGGKTREFVEMQKAWVRSHDVYGERQGFK